MAIQGEEALHLYVAAIGANLASLAEQIRQLQEEWLKADACQRIG